MPQTSNLSLLPAIETIFAPRDIILATLDLTGATLWLYLWQWIASKGWLERTVSRKIVHMTCTPFFMLTWPLFSDLSTSRLVASLVPLLMGSRLLFAGKGWTKDSISKIVSRKGAIEEALKGPLYYIIVTFLVTLFCWKDTPLGIVSLMQLCLGDGAAEVIGRRWGQNLRWPFCPEKSVLGTCAFYVAGLVASYASLAYFRYWGVSFIGQSYSLFSLSLVTLSCSIVELISWIDDNFSVPFTAIFVGYVLLEVLGK